MAILLQCTVYKSPYNFSTLVLLIRSNPCKVLSLQKFVRTLQTGFKSSLTVLIDCFIISLSSVRWPAASGSFGYTWAPSINFFLVKSRILGFGIRNPTKDWNPEFQGPLTKTGIQYLESRTHSVKSGIQDEDRATLSLMASWQWLDLATQLLYKQNM